MHALTVIVVHDVHAGQLQAAADRINGNGARMAQQPGFIDRQLLVSHDDSEKLSTITRWASLEAYEGWVAHNKANNPNAGIPAPFGTHPAELYFPYTDEEETP